jgi:hypothetical protein
VTALTVRQVQTPADLDLFIRLPWSLYGNDPAWVPPLIADVRELLNPKKNPYFGHARAVFFIAEKAGRIVGRISAQVCDLVQQHMGPGTGQWGMLELIDDADLAQALFTVAEAWLKSQGMTRALGPFSLSLWDEVGLLIDGFEHDPCFLTAHALPYYQKLVEGFGHGKVRDLYNYDLDLSKPFPDGTLRIVAAGERNAKIRLRKPDMNNIAAEVETVIEILNDAWSNNWGYVPFTDAEKKYAAKKMKPVVRADMVRFCEYDGEVAGFMWTVPDLNPTIKKLNGKLLPFGFMKLLWALRQNHWTQVRVPLMGIKQKFQSGRQGGLMVMMMFEHIKRDVVKHYGGQKGELGWILEDNASMRNFLDAIGSTHYKTYRIYEKAI